MASMSLMLNVETSTLIRYSDTMATKMLAADDPFSHLNARKITIPSRNMSRMSVKDMCMKSKTPSIIYLYYIRAKILNILYICRNENIYLGHDEKLHTNILCNIAVACVFHVAVSHRCE